MLAADCISEAMHGDREGEKSLTGSLILSEAALAIIRIAGGLSGG